MNERPYWKAPGVRATPEEAAEARRKMRVEENKRLQREARWIEEARTAWETGRIRPSAITMALDSRGLYGPDVDVQCGGAEPMVDMWEAGELYPRWEQYQALAKLTEYPLSFFYRDRPMPSSGWLCKRSGAGRGCFPIGSDDTTEVHTFTRQALDEAGVKYPNPYRVETR